MEHISVAQFVQEFPHAVVIVRGIVGSMPRARAALEGVRLQAVYRECFASTKHLGRAGRLSNKGVQRMEAWLVEEGLITRERRVRPDGSVTATGKSISGTAGTYLVDWSKLWLWVRELSQEWKRLQFRKMYEVGGHAVLAAWEYLRWFGSVDEWSVVPEDGGGPG